MRRFGSLSPFLEQGRAERRIGRLVANHDFIKALLRYGRFDEYVLANPSVANAREFLEVLDTWGLAPELRARIRAIPLFDLPALLTREDFHVFHVGGWGAFMPGLHTLRARYARTAFPITGMIFSIHGREMLDYAVRLTHAGLSPDDAVICLSTGGRDAFARLLDRGAAVSGRRFAGRLEPLPLGVDDDLLEGRGDRAAGRRRLQIPEEAIVLLALGRITPSQKMDLGPLLKVFAREILPRAGRPVVLVVAGGASDPDVRLLDSMLDAYGVRAWCRVHANFMARLKPDLLAASDLLVAVTDNTQETFGLSLLEALGHGRPVVASRFDGYKDLVADGVDGFLVDTWWCDVDPLGDLVDVMDPNVAQLVQAQSVAVDLPQLADRILRLVHDDDLRHAMGRAGREKVQSQFRFSAVIRRYEELWDDLAASMRRRTAGDEGWRQAALPVQLHAPDIFAGYPTRMLSDEDVVVAVPGVPIDPPYSETQPLLDAGLLRTVVERAAAPVAIGELLRCGPGERAWLAVMWLLKYGVLQLTRA